MTTSQATLDAPPDDPVFLHSRREFFLILGVWALCLVWVIPYCYLFGYRPITDASELPMVLGMPSWVVWGVAVPWLVADVATIAICIWVIRDDDLEPSAT